MCHINITNEVEQIFTSSDIEEGVCVLNDLQTTARLAIHSVIYSAKHKDMINEMKCLMPARDHFGHTSSTPLDAACHLRLTLAASTLSFTVTECMSLLGHSQGKLFCEFDEPRTRDIFTRVMKEN